MDHWSAGFIVAALIAAIVIGLAKGGLAGVGSLATPILALAAPPVQAAAILLPVLIAQDAISVWAFRKSWNRRIVAIMFPGALAGIIVAWAFAEMVPITAMMALLGVISIMFGLQRLWVERGGRIAAPSTSPGWVGALFGATTGFTSQIAHAGAPPFQMWVMPKRLPPLEFAGTGAVLFALINWAKVPAYVALGEFSEHDLWISAALIPIATVATLAGVRLVKHIQGRTFYTIVNILMIALGVKLVADAF